MTFDEPLLPESPHIQSIESVHDELRDATKVGFTRDHGVIKRWAAARQAEPATGEATHSGPATVSVNDGGAGIRFNFPGTGTFRPISWDEWLANFDLHEYAFVYDTESGTPLSSRYRIVKADDWKAFLHANDAV